MPARVPSDLAKPGLLARAPQRQPRIDGAEQLAAHVAEHERPAKMSMLLERRPHFDPERDLAWPTSACRSSC